MYRALLLIDALKDKGSSLVNEIKDGLPVATGKLKESVKSNVTLNGSIITLTIEAAPHFRNVENGRRAGAKMPPLDEIKKWTKVKGIPISAAWPIAAAIARRGIPAKHVLKGIIGKEEKGIAEMIRKAFDEEVKINFKDLVETTLMK